MSSNHFNEAAKTWDSAEKAARAALYARKIRERVALEPPLRVLDLGCGTGLLAFGFRDLARSILGVDTSPGMLEVFREKAAEVPGASALELDLEKGSLAGIEPFDLVVSSLAFHHFEDPAAMLAKLAGALTARGRIAVVDLDEEDGTFHPRPKEQGVRHFGFSAATAAAWAKGAGLRLLSREIVQELERNGRTYPVFLAVFGK